MALLKEGQTLDANTLEVIDAPKPVEKEATDEKEEGADDAADDVDGKKVEEPEAKKAEDEEEKEEESDEKKDDETDEPDAKKEEESDEKKDDETLGELDLELLDGYLAQTFEDKYGIKNEEDLQLHLEAAAEVEKENADLRAQLEEAKKTKPAFETEQEQKIFDFLKKYPVAKMGEGMATYARLVSMDVDNVAPRTALEEKFILEHEELTREEAMLKFNRDFDRKYKVKASAFDTTEEADAEQKQLDIDLKSDAAKAKKFLSKQQEEYKSKATDKVAEKETTAIPVQVQESVRTNLSEIDQYMGELDVINFSQDDGTPAFSYKLSKQQKEQIKTAMKGWIGNPASYEKDGKIRGEYDVETAAINAAAMLFHSDIFDKAYNAGLSKGEIKRADQIATKKPNREAKAAIDGKRIPLTEEEQWEAALAAKKKQPKKATY
jgi:hypothetical protein